MANKIISMYFTERRHKHNGEAVSQWEQACTGHEDFLEAMECHDGLRAAMLGEQNPFGTEGDTPIIAYMREGFKAVTARGIVTELQLIKVTQTVEIVDAPTVVSPGKIKPKKEAL